MTILSFLTEQSVVKLALSNSTSRADGSNTPESLLEGCINNQAVTQAFVVKYRAKGQVLGRNKMVIAKMGSSTMNTAPDFTSTGVVIPNNYAKQLIRGKENIDCRQQKKVKGN